MLFVPIKRLLNASSQTIKSEHLAIHILAVLVGVAAGCGAVIFREMIDLSQTFFLGFSSERVISGLAAEPAWRIILAPTIGGLMIGYFTHRFIPGGRPEGVAHVIEANALHAGRMSLRQGLAAAVVNAASVGAGASVGREGPVVHFGAAIASWLGRPFRLTRPQSRTLLGCGVAAAVAASFNAPIAGVFFALEVVIGHYALTAFAPIVIASVGGTLISRMYFGDVTAFILPESAIQSLWEFPAFGLLGLVSAGVAIGFMRMTMAVDTTVTKITQKSKLPRWLFPGLAGLFIGLLALLFPELIGVGYEATDNALKAQYGLWMLMILVVVKIIATSVCLGCGFGSGVFSPSLFLGAMVGGAFGLIAAMPFPELASDQGAYTLIGMGAVAGAVLGAPISTILMIFELTGDYRMTIGVMVAVSIASIVTRSLHSPSFFADQLAARGLNLSGAHEAGLLKAMQVTEYMHDAPITVLSDAPLDDVRACLLAASPGPVFVVEANGSLSGIVSLADLGGAAFDTSNDDQLTAANVARKRPAVVAAGDDLQHALSVFEDTSEALIAVVDNDIDRQLIGSLQEQRVIRAYRLAMERMRAEEHGE